MVKDQTLCFACLLPVAFLLAGACVLRWALARVPAGGGHVDAKGVRERPGWVLVFLCTIPTVDGQGVGPGLPWPRAEAAFSSPTVSLYFPHLSWVR